MRILAILITAAALALGACAGRHQPIYNVTNAPIILPSGKSASMTDIQNAIVRAATGLGWQVQPEGPGRVSGRLALRQHLAVVDIEHDTKTFSIKYKDSSNLDARDGMIHNNYNGWVQNLEKAIRTQLQFL